MGVGIPGDFKVVRIKRDFALNVFVLTRFQCRSWRYYIVTKAWFEVVVNPSFLPSSLSTYLTIFILDMH